MRETWLIHYIQVGMLYCFNQVIKNLHQPNFHYGRTHYRRIILMWTLLSQHNRLKKRVESIIYMHQDTCNDSIRQNLYLSLFIWQTTPMGKKSHFLSQQSIIILVMTTLPLSCYGYSSITERHLKAKAKIKEKNKNYDGCSLIVIVSMSICKLTGYILV